MARKNMKNLDVEKQDALTDAVDMPEHEQKHDFDAWFATRESKIPRHHYKEIIKADFRGRGLSEQETMEVFDAALGKYGIKLN